jgi:hypothetical protein
VVQFETFTVESLASTGTQGLGLINLRICLRYFHLLIQQPQSRTVLPVIAPMMAARTKKTPKNNAQNIIVPKIAPRGLQMIDNKTTMPIIKKALWGLVLWLI